MVIKASIGETIKLVVALKKIVTILSNVMQFKFYRLHK